MFMNQWLSDGGNVYVYWKQQQKPYLFNAAGSSIPKQPWKSMFADIICSATRISMCYENEELGFLKMTSSYVDAYLLYLLSMLIQ